MAISDKNTGSVARVLGLAFVAGALGACAVDEREVRTFDLESEQPAKESVSASADEEASPMGGDAEENDPGEPSVSVCETPNCPANRPLQQGVDQTNEDAQVSSNSDSGSAEEPVAEEPVAEELPSSCPADDVCRRFDENCTVSFTPAAREGAACQCDDSGCQLIVGEPCGLSRQCASGDCRATESSSSVCCAPGCSGADTCSSDGSACIQPKVELGTSCFADDECLSNSCVDGVCCDETCEGPCETCADSGRCRAAFDDNSCPIIRCGALDATCAESTEDIQTNRCQSKGACKTLAACGLAPAGIECLTGVCNDAGECRAPTVNCGGPCETSGIEPGVTCCSFADSFALTCVDTRSCVAPPNIPISCDERSDCLPGNVCCSVSTPLNAFVACRPEADCRPQLGVRASFRQVCVAPGASSSPCPAGQTCRPITPGSHLGGWSLCTQFP